MSGPTQMFAALAASAAMAASAATVDPFTHLAEARRASADIPTFQVPPEMMAAHKKNYDQVATNSSTAMNLLGEMIKGKDGSCPVLTSIYNNNKVILDQQVTMAAMGIGAQDKLKMLDGSLKYQKIEQKFAETGAALKKRCPDSTP